MTMMMKIQNNPNTKTSERSILSSSTKGRVQKIKMEIQDGICHEGGGGLEGVSFAIKLFWKMIFVKNHLESFPDCENVFCT